MVSWLSIFELSDRRDREEQTETFLKSLWFAFVMLRSINSARPLTRTRRRFIGTPLTNSSAMVAATPLLTSGAAVT